MIIVVLMFMLLAIAVYIGLFIIAFILVSIFEIIKYACGYRNDNDW